METPTYTIKNLPDLLSISGIYSSEIWYWRGQSNSAWPLLPKAGRKEYYLDEDNWAHSTPRDIARFNHWRELAIAYHEKIPQNDFECLAFAQHYGLATRFLDWTTNPLVALYFAACATPDQDGIVFLYAPNYFINSKEADICKFPEVAIFRPPPFDRRILTQSGCLSYHPSITEPLISSQLGSDYDGLDYGHKSNLIHVIIPSESKAYLLIKLNDCGINRKTVFPDLEGLSSFINWQSNRKII